MAIAHVKKTQPVVEAVTLELTGYEATLLKTLLYCRISLNGNPEAEVLGNIGNALEVAGVDHDYSLVVPESLSYSSERVMFRLQVSH